MFTTIVIVIVVALLIKIGIFKSVKALFYTTCWLFATVKDNIFKIAACVILVIIIQNILYQEVYYEAK